MFKTITVLYVEDEEQIKNIVTSLFGTLFVSMGKAAKDKELDLSSFSDIFTQGVESVKQRGKADLGEKTMLDTLIPVANRLLSDASNQVAFVDCYHFLQQLKVGFLLIVIQV